MRLTHRYVLLLVVASACARRTNSQCYPGGGAEVWVERHLTGSGRSSEASMTIQMVPDSAGPPRAEWQSVIALSSDSSATQYARVDATGKVVFSLPPGRYSINVKELLFAPVTRSVTLGQGERVSIELQRRRAAYCLGPVVRTAM